MSHAPKIATCCYCGSRVALVLGEGRHELACGSCGAPLHDLKRLPVAAVARHRDNPRLPASPSEPAPVPRRKQAGGAAPRPKPTKKKRKKHKKRKSLGRWFLEEAFDKIEDIFD